MTGTRVLVVGGVDPTGRAGIARDVAALEAERVEPAVAVTALTVQDVRGVQSVQPVDADVLLRSLEAAASLGDLKAIKVGLVPTRELGEVVSRFARGIEVPLVVDPVMRASTGEPLGTGDLAARLTPLFSAATIVTPNLDELAALAGPFQTIDERVQAAQRLRGSNGLEAVLVKGGHGTETPGIDLLVHEQVDVLTFRRLDPPSGSARGKGCELASRISALLAKGLDVPQAVQGARRRLQERLRREARLAETNSNSSDLAVYDAVLERLMAQLEPRCVPEVGLNLAYAPRGVDDAQQVIGLAGRVTIAGDSFAVTGRPVPGGPHHTGRIAATAQRLTKESVWVFNHRYDAALLPAPEAGHVAFRREQEPEAASSSMEWMTEAAIGGLGGLPAYVSDAGMAGKEAMIRVFASSPEQLLARHDALHQASVQRGVHARLA